MTMLRMRLEPAQSAYSKAIRKHSVPAPPARTAMWKHSPKNLLIEQGQRVFSL